MTTPEDEGRASPADPEGTAYHAEVLTPAELARHRDAWAELADRSIEPCVFFEPGFALPAMTFLARGRRPFAVAVWLAQAGPPPVLVGLCLIGPARAASFRGVAAWLHPQATAAFPLLDRTHAHAALATLLRNLASLPGAPPALLLSGVQADGEMERLIGQAGHSFVRLDPRSRAILPGQHASVRQHSAKHRKELRRQANRLTELGQPNLKSYAGAEIEIGLEFFLKLEASGWKGRRGTALAADRGRAAFVGAMVPELGREGKGRIDLLFFGDRPVAGGIFLRSARRGYFWKTGYDEGLRAMSPGVHFVLATTARQSAMPGLDWTDSCAIPGHSMIDKLWPGRTEMIDLLIATRPDAAAAFAVAASLERTRRKMQQIARRALVDAARTVRGLRRGWGKRLPP